MDVELSGGLRDIQVVLEELIDRRQCFFIELIRGSILEDLLDEHLAEGNRKLVDQTTDTKYRVCNNGMFLEEDLTYIESKTCFLIGTGYFLQFTYDGAIGDADFFAHLSLEHLYNTICEILNVFIIIGRIQFSYDDDIAFIYSSDEVSGLSIEENGSSPSHRLHGQDQLPLP